MQCPMQCPILSGTNKLSTRILRIRIRKRIMLRMPLLRLLPLDCRTCGPMRNPSSPPPLPRPPPLPIDQSLHRVKEIVPCLWWRMMTKMSKSIFEAETVKVVCLLVQKHIIIYVITMTIRMIRMDDMLPGSYTCLLYCTIYRKYYNNNYLTV